MTSPNSEQLVRQRDLIPFVGLFLSVVLFGLTSASYGYIPFSPIFCVHHGALALSIYALFLTSLWSYEMRFSRYSVRPEREEDQHHPFWLYMGMLALWLGVFVPQFWVILGDLLARGASLDHSLYQTMNLWICCLLLGLIVWRARHWAHECKDISRVNRVSPPHYTEVSPMMNRSEAEHWTPISPSMISPHLAESLHQNYKDRRRKKLARDSQSLTALQALPNNQTRQIVKRNPNIRRSTGDYDTRFDAYPPEFDQYAQASDQIEPEHLTLYQPEFDHTFAPSTEEPPALIDPTHKAESEQFGGSDTLVMPPQLDLIEDLTQHLSNEEIAIWEEVNDIL